MDVSQEVPTALGGWAIEYKPLLTPAAFDELERRVMSLVKAERERATIEAVRGFMEIGAEMDARRNDR